MYCEWFLLFANEELDKCVWLPINLVSMKMQELYGMCVLNSLEPDCIFEL
jgi:hypothetical protein